MYRSLFSLSDEISVCMDGCFHCLMKFLYVWMVVFLIWSNFCLHQSLFSLSNEISLHINLWCSWSMKFVCTSLLFSLSYRFSLSINPRCSWSMKFLCTQLLFLIDDFFIHRSSFALYDDISVYIDHCCSGLMKFLYTLNIVDLVHWRLFISAFVFDW